MITQQSAQPKQIRTEAGILHNATDTIRVVLLEPTRAQQHWAEADCDLCHKEAVTGRVSTDMLSVRPSAACADHQLTYAADCLMWIFQTRGQWRGNRK